MTSTTTRNCKSPKPLDFGPLASFSEFPQWGASENWRLTFRLDVEDPRKGAERQRSTAVGRPTILDTLAVTERWQARLETSGVNRADLAREHGVSRARVTQVMALLELEPRILDWARANAGEVSERRLRLLLRLSPQDQLRLARRSGMIPQHVSAH
jgi:hypothetical protein